MGRKFNIMLTSCQIISLWKINLICWIFLAVQRILLTICKSCHFNTCRTTTRKSLSTYPSGREESHTMCDLFSKQHHVICCQVVDPSDPMMILVENPPGFSEIAQQVTSPQVLHDKYWLS